MLYDFLFELTEFSDNEGEQILVECETLGDAREILRDNGFTADEVKFLGRMSVELGEALGYDTY